MPVLRRLTLDDLWTFKWMGNIALSPDGRRVAFVMHSSDKTKNERQSAIYLLQREEEDRIRDHTITTIWYRLDGRGIFEKFSQLFVMPAPGDGPVDPAAIRR